MMRYEEAFGIPLRRSFMLMRSDRLHKRCPGGKHLRVLSCHPSLRNRRTARRRTLQSPPHIFPTAPPGGDAQTEKPPETTAVREPGKITVTYLTENVKKGSRATLSVAGTPGITYSIAVYYSSSVSAAKGLEPKSADSNGNVSWSWRVGSPYKAGKTQNRDFRRRGEHHPVFHNDMSIFPHRPAYSVPTNIALELIQYADGGIRT